MIFNNVTCAKPSPGFLQIIGTKLFYCQTLSERVNQIHTFERIHSLLVCEWFDFKTSWLCLISSHPFPGFCIIRILIALILICFLAV